MLSVSMAAALAVAGPAFAGSITPGPANLMLVFSGFGSVLSGVLSSPYRSRLFGYGMGGCC